jgi:hypothetical protein
MGGCCLETTSPLARGTFGFVDIQGNDASIAEVARVADVAERPGASSPFLVRLEFLPIALPFAVNTSADRRGAATLVEGEEKAGWSQTVGERTGEEDGRDGGDQAEKQGSSRGKRKRSSLADDLK